MGTQITLSDILAFMSAERKGVTEDLFWFFNDGDDDAVWLMNNRLQVHMLSFGFAEGSD